MNEGITFNLQPEVLFSLYEPKPNVEPYLQVFPLLFNSFKFAFPSGISIDYKPTEPKFFTFMSTSSEGLNDFFHVLVVYEEITQADLQYDFEPLPKLLAQERDKQLNQVNRKTEAKDPPPEDISEAQKNKKHQLWLQRQQTTRCLNVSDVQQLTDNLQFQSLAMRKRKKTQRDQNMPGATGILGRFHKVVGSSDFSERYNKS